MSSLPPKKLSTPVSSKQQDILSNWELITQRHLSNSWEKKPAIHSLKSFEKIHSLLQIDGRPIILDTGCGVGLSTFKLQESNPEYIVLGLDKSEIRLEQAKRQYPNIHFFRVEIADFWLLAFKAKLKFSKQFFYYPNPWPKPAQALRRWHFHPIFPYALSCGGSWQLRTNWDIYAKEFATVVERLTQTKGQLEIWNPICPETAFEIKYKTSRHQLWRFTCQIPDNFSKTSYTLYNKIES